MQSINDVLSSSTVEYQNGEFIDSSDYGRMSENIFDTDEAIVRTCNNKIQSLISTTNTTPLITTYFCTSGRDESPILQNNSTDILSTALKHKSTSNVAFTYDNLADRLNNEHFDEAFKFYTLFGHSTNFFLGERLLAEHYLPRTSAFS